MTNRRKKGENMKRRSGMIAAFLAAFLILTACERVNEVFPETEGAARGVNDPKDAKEVVLSDDAASDSDAETADASKTGESENGASKSDASKADSKEPEKKDSKPEADDKKTAEDTGSPAKTLSEEELQKAIDRALPGIVCWGDSITYGYLSSGANYPDVLREKIDKELIEPIRNASGYTSLKTPEVLNFGVSAEKTSEIAGRAGGDPYLLGESIVIPADTKPVKDVVLMSKDKEEIRPLQEVAPLRAGVSYRFGAEYYTIGGVTGKLERYYDEAADRSRYQFTRLTAGKEVRIDTGTPFVPDSADGRYRSYIGIVLMGANGGYKDDGGEDLASQFRSIVSGYDKYLCIGMSRAGIRTYAGDLDPSYAPALTRAFGDRFLSIQELLNGNDNPDTTIPGYLLAPDGLHYTDEGYIEIGNRIFEKLDSLGYFDELKALG